MAVKSRRVRGDIFVDNVDFKRVAREFLKSAEAGSQPKSIEAALQAVAVWLGYPNLHAINVESLVNEDVASPMTSHESGVFGSTPYRLHPLVASGQVTPSAQCRITAERLIELVTSVCVQLCSAHSIRVDSEFAEDFLRLEYLEGFCWRDNSDFHNVDARHVAALQSYLLSIPGYNKSQVFDQRTDVTRYHQDVVTLIATPPYGWSMGGGHPYLDYLREASERRKSASSKQGARRQRSTT